MLRLKLTTVCWVPCAPGTCWALYTCLAHLPFRSRGVILPLGHERRLRCRKGQRWCEANDTCYHLQGRSPTAWRGANGQHSLSHGAVPRDVSPLHSARELESPRKAELTLEGTTLRSHRGGRISFHGGHGPLWPTARVCCRHGAMFSWAPQAEAPSLPAGEIQQRH